MRIDQVTIGRGRSRHRRQLRLRYALGNSAFEAMMRSCSAVEPILGYKSSAIRCVSEKVCEMPQDASTTNSACTPQHALEPCSAEMADHNDGVASFSCSTACNAALKNWTESCSDTEIPLSSLINALAGKCNDSGKGSLEGVLSSVSVSHLGL